MQKIIKNPIYVFAIIGLIASVINYAVYLKTGEPIIVVMFVLLIDVVVVAVLRFAIEKRDRMER